MLYILQQIEPLKPKPQVISFVCPSCEAELELEGTVEDWSGQIIACPSCNTETTFPDPAAEKESKPAPEQEAANPDEHRCPSCKELLPERAIFCVNCGYNLRTREHTEIDTGEKTAGDRKEISISLAADGAEGFCGKCGERVFYGADLDLDFEARLSASVQ